LGRAVFQKDDFCSCIVIVIVLKIRPAIAPDVDTIWNIFQQTVATGDTYAFDPHISREAALA
jgi:hypothetical protein